MTGKDDAVVKFLDVKPTIEVEKTANPISLPEPGGNVTFGVKVINPQTAAEPVEIVSLVDDVYGDLTKLPGSCVLTPGLLLAVGGTYSCSFTVFVGGVPDETKTDMITGQAKDDEGNIAEDTARATVTITDVLPEVVVEKTADPTAVPETGGLVTFTVRVRNPATAVEDIVLSELTDSVYGDLGAKPGCSLTPAVKLGIGKEFVCTFSETVKGDFPEVHKNTVTVAAEDDEENRDTATDDAEVTLTDVIPTILVDKAALPETLPEPGGNVTYAVSVTNTSLENVILTNLVDDPFGPLPGKSNCLADGPVTILPAGTYTCTFTAPVRGNANTSHTDTVTATGEDDDGTHAAGHRQGHRHRPQRRPGHRRRQAPRPQPGGRAGRDGEVHRAVTNPGTAEDLILTSLKDDVYGDLNNQGDCKVPQTITTGGGQYTCTFSGEVKGDAGSAHSNTVTAAATDDDGTEVSDAARATVTVFDVEPTVLVAKSAAPSTLPEPGGTATFTVTVTNPASAVEPIKLTSLTDSVFGSLNGDSTVHAGDAVTFTYVVHNLGVEPLREVAVADDRCSPVALTGGDADGDDLLDLTETWTFSCTAKLTGTTSNTATSTGKDDEGNTATDRDTATVTVVDPKIVIDKLADLATVTVGDSVTYAYTVTNPGNAPWPTSP